VIPTGPRPVQGRPGTTSSRSLPPNGQDSLTLPNGFRLVQPGVVPVPGKWLYKFRQSRPRAARSGPRYSGE